MLTLTIPSIEIIDEDTSEIRTINGATIQLEHSLVSVSKWESKWHVPFLAKEKKTSEQLRSYVQCMTITQNVNPAIYNNLSEENVKEIQAYIDDPHSATKFSNFAPKGSGRGKREVMTSELIYYYMSALNIPFECQKWNFNRLMNLLHIASLKQDPKGGKKMSRKEIYAQNSRLNEARRAALGTKG